MNTRSTLSMALLAAILLALAPGVSAALIQQPVAGVLVYPAGGSVSSFRSDDVPSDTDVEPCPIPILVPPKPGVNDLRDSDTKVADLAPGPGPIPIIATPKPKASAPGTCEVCDPIEPGSDDAPPPKPKPCPRCDPPPDSARPVEDVDDTNHVKCLGCDPTAWAPVYRA